MSTGNTLQFLLTAGLLIAVYSYKWALHFQYLRVKNKKNPGHWVDYYKRTFNHKNDKRWWNESILLFPLLYPVILTDNRKEDFWLSKIKRINIVLYLLLIILLLTGIYFAKSPSTLS